MTFRDCLLNADVELTSLARNVGKAKLEVWYYGDRKGIVRKIIEVHPIKTDEFYDKGIEED